MTVTFRFDVEDDVSDDTIRSLVTDAFVQIDEAVDWSALPPEELGDPPRVDTSAVVTDIVVDGLSL